MMGLTGRCRSRVTLSLEKGNRLDLFHLFQVVAIASLLIGPYSVAAFSGTANTPAALPPKEEETTATKKVALISGANKGTVRL